MTSPAPPSAPRKNGNGRGPFWWRYLEKQDATWVAVAALLFVLGYWVVHPVVEHQLSEAANDKAHQRSEDAKQRDHARKQDLALSSELWAAIREARDKQTEIVERQLKMLEHMADATTRQKEIKGKIEDIRNAVLGGSGP